MTAFLTRKVGLSRMIPLGQSLPQDPRQLEDLILIDITHRSYVQTDRTDQTRSHASHGVKSCQRKLHTYIHKLLDCRVQRYWTELDTKSVRTFGPWQKLHFLGSLVLKVGIIRGLARF